MRFRPDHGSQLMFVDRGLWPPPNPEPPPEPKRRMTEAEEKRLGWALALFAIAMFVGPLAGSSVIVAVVAICRAAF